MAPQSPQLVLAARQASRRARGRVQETCLATYVAMTHAHIATEAAEGRLTALDREQAALRGVYDVRSALALPVWHSKPGKGMSLTAFFV